MHAIIVNKLLKQLTIINQCTVFINEVTRKEIYMHVENKINSIAGPPQWIIAIS